MNGANGLLSSTGKKLVAAGAAGFAAYWAALYLAQAKLVFNPVSEPPASCALPSNHRAVPVAIPVKGGTLKGVCFLPDTSAPFPVAIYFHGRGEDCRWLDQIIDHLPGVALLCVNYRGFGESSGSPTEALVVQDGLTLVQWAKSVLGSNSVHLIGRSLGSGLAIQVAARESSVKSLTLVTPYDSIVEIARLRFPLAPVGFLLKHRFESRNHAKGVQSPTLFIKAERDDVVPHERTRALQRGWPAAFEEVTILGSDHLDIVYKKDTWLNINSFLKEFA